MKKQSWSQIVAFALAMIPVVMLVLVVGSSFILSMRALVNFGLDGLFGPILQSHAISTTVYWYGLAGPIWGTILVQRGGVLGGCLATIAAGSCFGHAFLHVSVVTLDRMMLLAVGVLYVVYRRLALIKPKTWGKPDVVLVAFILTLL